MDVEIPRLIGKLEGMANGDLPVNESELQNELYKYNEKFYKHTVAELAEDAISVVAQDGCASTPPVPMYIGFSTKSLSASEGLRILEAVTKEAHERGIIFNVWSFDSEFSCIYRNYYVNNPSTFIIEVKAIKQEAQQLHVSQICSEIASYISCVFDFEPAITAQEVERECNLLNMNQYDGPDLSQVTIRTRSGIMHMNTAEFAQIEKFALSLRRNQLIWQVQREKKLQCSPSTRTKACLNEMYSRIHIFCRRYGYDSIIQQGVAENETAKFTPWELERLITDGLEEFDPNKIRFQFNEYLSNPVISPTTKKLLFFAPCINHLLKNVRHTVGSGRNPTAQQEAKTWHAAYTDISKKNSSWLTQLEVDGCTDPQSVDIMLKMFSSKAISLLNAEGHIETARMAEAMNGLHRAFDERGLTKSERRNLILRARTWLLRDVDWMRVGKKHMRGLSSVTFEGLIVAMDTHLQIQSYLSNNKGVLGEKEYDFNARTLCTDSVENLWSLIGHLNKKDFLRKFNKACTELSKKFDPNLPFVYDHSKKRIILSRPRGEKKLFNAEEGTRDKENECRSQPRSRKRIHTQSLDTRGGFTGQMPGFQGLRTLSGCKSTEEEIERTKCQKLRRVQSEQV
ncbi:hypothetical protein GUITHDRAFT_117952 [Guillardia theta CCMP2712]|uniref:Uncharacterized protein n=1 Tax=Guillardia theta (strain CCMP2712) TaxID=905079 RepID=L1IJ29_GUITC|nr:hypothetical protein GUITHDRAFT_117952 [Guillardia theta CCMP2712]EKX35919.1 hypothetical protein GUITHDRAFT_117952 [Guillardia theta CCMP2712]|eukprot:XP_005822899.1 hypothetical protein GUITHDRAFT_117952 [Guillardia theta CCMP2712]